MFVTFLLAAVMTLTGINAHETLVVEITTYVGTPPPSGPRSSGGPRNHISSSSKSSSPSKMPAPSRTVRAETKHRDSERRKHNEKIAKEELAEEARELKLGIRQEEYALEQAKISSDVIKTEEGEYRSEIERVTEKRNTHVQYLRNYAKDGIFRMQSVNFIREQLVQDAISLSYSHEFIREADTQFVDNDPESGELSLKIAEALIDITTSITPGISWGRDIFEAISGKSFIDGSPLSDLEIGTAVFGAATAGFGSKILKGMKLLERVGVKAKDLHRLIDWSVFTKRAENAKIIKTPWGEAAQEMGDAALYARFQAENGATLYKVGGTGFSETTTAQFWSLKNPLSVKDYAQKYGIKEEIAAEFNFIQTAVIKDGVNFVTRVSPAQGLNLGGELEVVVDVGDVVLQSFHTIEKGVIK